MILILFSCGTFACVLNLSCGAFACVLEFLSGSFACVLNSRLACVLDVSYGCCLWPAVRLLAFYNFLCCTFACVFACGLWFGYFIFANKNLKFLHVFPEFGPLEAHFGINFGPQEPFGRHLEFESKKGRPKGAKTIPERSFWDPRGGFWGPFWERFWSIF